MPTELSTNLTSLRTEDEEVWGPVTEYRVLQQLRVHLVFPLRDSLEDFCELVLRMVSADGSKRDLTLEVRDLRLAPAAQVNSRQAGPVCYTLSCVVFLVLKLVDLSDAFGLFSLFLFR